MKPRAANNPAQTFLDKTNAMAMVKPIRYDLLGYNLLRELQSELFHLPFQWS